MSNPGPLRLKAIQVWAIALLLLGGAVVAQPPVVVPWLRAVLSPLGSGSTTTILNLIGPGVPYLPWVLAGLGVWVGWSGWQIWQRSHWRGQVGRGRSRAQLPRSSEAIAAILTPLSRQGWTLESPVKVAGAGVVDYLLRSPQGQAFAIQSQSHSGKIGRDGNPRGEQLVRRYDQSSQTLEIDILAQARQQAASLQRQLNTPVLPLVIFPQAQLDIGNNPVQGVYVLTPNQLRTTLLSLARPRSSR